MGDPLRILGIDPGTKRCGWCLVEATEHRGHARFVSGGWADIDEVRALATSGTADVVAVESPKGYVYQPARGAALIETAKFAADIARAAIDAGTRVFECSAMQWRRAVCGKGNSSNRRIANTLPLFLAGLPPRTNNHLRDAAGVAICAAWNPGAYRAA